MSTNPETVNPETVNSEIINPQLCPICQQDNRCGNLLSCGSDKSCWCSSSEIQFSEKLLNQIPNEVKNKACICKACALAHK